MMRSNTSKDSSRGFQVNSEISFLISARKTILTSSGQTLTRHPIFFCVWKLNGLGICSVRQREGSERGGHGRLAKLRRPVSCPGQSIPKCTFFPFYYFLSLFLSLLLKRKYSIFSLMPNDVIWTLEPQPSGRSPRRGTKGQKEARAAGPTGARTTGGGEPLPRPCRRGVSGMRARGLWLAPPPRRAP